jgi:hypothetical protein
MNARQFVRSCWEANKLIHRVNFPVFTQDCCTPKTISGGSVSPASAKCTRFDTVSVSSSALGKTRTPLSWRANPCFLSLSLQCFIEKARVASSAQPLFRCCHLWMPARLLLSASWCSPSSLSLHHRGIRNQEVAWGPRSGRWWRWHPVRSGSDGACACTASST